MRRSASRNRSGVGDQGSWRPFSVPSSLKFQKENFPPVEKVSLLKEKSTPVEKVSLLKEKSTPVEKVSLQTKKSPPVEEFDPEKENSDCDRNVNGLIWGLTSPEMDTDSNLDRFLRLVSPIVPARPYERKNSKQWEKDAARRFPYYVLEDLWESFQEWSAYGAGAPLLMNGSEPIVQYYVPYLSGIQLYRDPSSSSSVARGQQESQYIRVQDRCCKEITESQMPLNSMPPGPGVIAFQYFETVPPYMRETLADKIEVLASQFPELNTYRSCHLSPLSWLSVAWYPIYRIPAGSTLKKLDACFLTFHSLSTRTSSYPLSHHRGRTGWKEDQLSHLGSTKITLPVFGLACQKFKASEWGKNQDTVCSLVEAADSWLKCLRVKLPDFSFFLTRSYQNTS